MGCLKKINFSNLARSSITQAIAIRPQVLKQYFALSSFQAQLKSWLSWVAVSGIIAITNHLPTKTWTHGFLKLSALAELTTAQPQLVTLFDNK